MTNREKNKVVIFGGNGFVGCRLVAALHELQYDIAVFDVLRVNHNHEMDGVTYVQGDICHKVKVCEFISLHKPHFVVHLSSWGMSGAAMLDEKCYDVNVLGTQNIIDACLESGVNYLIYTSTYNVVFGGNEIVNGDESIPSYDYKLHSDKYSPSKTLAEQLVLSINGTFTSSKRPLLTCSLRPAAIYGEGESRHFPRIVKHIDRQVQAYLCTMSKFSSAKRFTDAPAGQTYFISDGTPMLNFEFLRPLCIARGAEYPSVTLPVSFAILLAALCEDVYRICKILYIPLEPFMTRAEVYKVGVTHFFSIAKAQKELNYRPTITSQEGSQRMADYYSNKHFFRFTGLIWWILIFTGMGLLYYFAYEEEPIFQDYAVLNSIRDFSYTIFQSQANLRVVFILAVLTHLAEGVYATYYAYSIGCSVEYCFYWFLQTCLFGYASLSLLLKRCRVLPA